jgi:hypothetical protein
MADISFTDLDTAFGIPGAVSIVGNKISFDAQSCMGEAALVMADMKVAEFFTALLSAANKAQETYNANPANPADLASYPAPFSSVPLVDDADGKSYVTNTYSFSSRAPLDIANATAVLA